MTEIPITLTTRGGTVSRLDIVVTRAPCEWTEEDAKSFAWAVARAIEATGLYRLQLVEEVPCRTWHLELEGTTGTASTRAVELSPEAAVWFERVAFTLVGDRHT